MDEVEFMWFKHLMTEMFPALTSEFGVMVRPRFNVGDEQAWHFPIGRVRKLDGRLTERIEGHPSMRLADYY